MNALLLYPRFPKTFWSFESVLKLVGRKALLPPLGLATVAAMLPKDWNLKLIDRNVGELTESDWGWADIILLSAMIVQREDFLGLVREAGRRGKPVAVGGPYPTSLPDEADDAGADYLVLDEGEHTIPAFLEHLSAHGPVRRDAGASATQFTSRDNKPDMSLAPIPRFELLDLEAYDGMAVQYSRGCPFLCEFCDIITLYGRRPRAKSPIQLCAELDALYELGWRGSIFLVDDNFIGNKRNVKSLLRELETWQKDRGYPFWFDTEASIDLASDDELLDLMKRCRFASVFIGVETPDATSLAITRKHQNNRHPLVQSIEKISAHGLRVMCGLIVGFDGEEPGAGQRIVDFVETTNIPTALLSILQALPNTALWDRLAKEGRLLHSAVDLNQTNLLNFVPTRPASQIAAEYLEAYEALYDPVNYLRRTHRYFSGLGGSQTPRTSNRDSAPKKVDLREPALKTARKKLIIAGAFLKIAWRQGVARKSRWAFWPSLIDIAIHKPQYIELYLSVCAHNEHFLEYRRLLRQSIKTGLASLPDRVYTNVSPKAPPGQAAFFPAAPQLAGARAEQAGL